jgi:hypothetical protein
MDILFSSMNTLLSSATSLFYPLLIQIVLTFIIFIILGKRKIQGLKSSRIDLKKAALNEAEWPDSVKKASNNLANQFQTPILFYVLILLIYVVHTASARDDISFWPHIFAWVYTISRIAHAFIHLNTNYVPTRFAFFLMSILSLFGLTGYSFMLLIETI